MRGDEDVANTSTDVGNDVVEEIGVVETRDEEVAEAVVDDIVKVVVSDKVSKAVVKSEEEVLSEFKDSKDKDYRESSEDVAGDSEGSSSEVEFDRSDDRDYKESSRVVDDDKEGRLSDVSVNRSDNGIQSSGVVDDDDEEVIAIRPVDSRDSNPNQKRMARKRKV